MLSSAQTILVSFFCCAFKLSCFAAECLFLVLWIAAVFEDCILSRALSAKAIMAFLLLWIVAFI